MNVHLLDSRFHGREVLSARHGLVAIPVALFNYFHMNNGASIGCHRAWSKLECTHLGISPVGHWVVCQTAQKVAMRNDSDVLLWSFTQKLAHPLRTRIEGLRVSRVKTAFACPVGRQGTQIIFCKIRLRLKNMTC